MALLVCLANSHKHGARCIAGKLLDTGAWVRPVSGLEHGEIAWDMRRVDWREPQVLDVLDVPLEGCGPDYGCQPENRLLAPGAWRKAGAAAPDDILKYVDAIEDRALFYNYVDRVPMTTFRRLPRGRWRSLQLVHCGGVDFHPDARKPQDWRATFDYREAQYADLKVTDPIAEIRLARGERLDGPCLLTLSLGMPFRPTRSLREYCFKLVSGVICLNDAR